MTILETQAMGLAELLRQQRGSAPAPFPVADSALTPQEVLQKLNRTDVEYKTFDATVRSQAPGVVRPQFATSWAAQLADWNAFYQRTQQTISDPGFFTVINTRSLSDNIDTYRQQLVGWNDALRIQSPGTVPVGPPPVPVVTNPGPMGPSAPTIPGGNGGGSSLPWWVTAGLTVAVLGGVAYAGYTAYRYVKGGSTVIRLARRATGRDEDFEVLESPAHPKMDSRLLPYPHRPRRDFPPARGGDFHNR